MNAAILATLVLFSGVGIACAQAPAPERPAGAARLAAGKLSERAAHEAAVTDCERMWDRGTHMSKHQWSQACRRVQDRLRALDAK